MPKPQPRRVQKVTLGRQTNEAAAAPATIRVVAHHRMPNRGKVYTNLVRSPRVQMCAQEIRCLESGQPDERRPRGLPLVDDCHTGAVSRIATDGSFHRDFVDFHMTP